MKVCVGLLFPLSAPSERSEEPLVPWQIFTFFLPKTHLYVGLPPLVSSFLLFPLWAPK